MSRNLLLIIYFLRFIHSRIERIEDLKARLKNEENIEKRTITYLKNRSDSFVTFRWVCLLKCLNYTRIHMHLSLYVYIRILISLFFSLCLWSILDILENVDRRNISSRVEYPNSYLRLPLLKFEMLYMVAAPPYVFEENRESTDAIKLLKFTVTAFSGKINGKSQAEDCQVMQGF